VLRINEVCDADTNHWHFNLLIFRPEWGNVKCTCEWEYERRTCGLLKKKHYLTTTEWNVKNWRSWCTENWSKHILGWCHIKPIKPKTYSALLPLKSYGSPYLWNEFMGVTKHFLQSIFRYYDVGMIYLQSYGDLMRIFVSRNIIHVHLNIVICTSRIRQQNRTFEQIYSKFYQRKALTSTSTKNMAELFNHVYGL
jgi:hypothetical protein